MSIEGQGHFFTIYFPGFVCFVLYLDKISGERLQDHWSSGLFWYMYGSVSAIFDDMGCTRNAGHVICMISSNVAWQIVDVRKARKIVMKSEIVLNTAN